MASRYAAELQRLGLDHIRVVCPLYTYTLRDGSVVVVSPYVQGEVLMDLVRCNLRWGVRRGKRGEKRGRGQKWRGLRGFWGRNGKLRQGAS